MSTPRTLWSADVAQDVRDRVDGVHLEALAALVSAFTGDDLDVRRTVARSGDPHLLALTLAHAAGFVLRRVRFPERHLSALYGRVDVDDPTTTDERQP